jgi:hypothetical protein
MGADLEVIDEVDELWPVENETDDDADRRAFRRLQSSVPLPVGRWFHPTSGMGYSPELIEALEADLDRLRPTPPSVRFVALLLLAETLIGVANYDRGEEHLIEADSLATSMASERARSLITNARGIAAARQGDFELACHLFADASSRGMMPRRNATDVRLMWNHLRCRVLSGRRITGAEVRSAWDVVRDESIPNQTWRAAISSAVIVDHEGHHDLAVRLAGWVRRTYPGDVELVYVAEFAVLGLSTEMPMEADAPIEDIDRLMAEVLAITDNM